MNEHLPDSAATSNGEKLEEKSPDPSVERSHVAMNSKPELPQGANLDPSRAGAPARAGSTVIRFADVISGQYDADEKVEAQSVPPRRS